MRGILISTLFILYLGMQGCDGHNSIALSPSLEIDFYMYNGCGIFDSTSIRPLVIEVPSLYQNGWVPVNHNDFTTNIAFSNDSIKKDSLTHINLTFLGTPERYKMMRIVFADLKLWKGNWKVILNDLDTVLYPVVFEPLGDSYRNISLVIDLNAAVSIVNIGPKGNPLYRFKDRTRLAGIIRGEIRGTVINNRNQGVAYCILGKDTITSAVASGNPGIFRFRFLSKGNYDISIADSLGMKYATTVPLGEGQKIDLGDITLH